MFRADIRELNQDYKAHLAHHNEKAQSYLIVTDIVSDLTIRNGTLS